MRAREVAFWFAFALVLSYVIAYGCLGVDHSDPTPIFQGPAEARP